ncbi:molybdate ABC transporter permease subunit [uncultured Desulfuromusa sp.]|uniref:molybdate ABC transporter permease subunit n=1 Tax=uncultured Desulfuromusa sp. TaxID=219183 RepID=UPI002AA60DFD|nr:molybdate ABC transporter permease subunit [uncultured Desulfuromusa sp.]
MLSLTPSDLQAIWLSFKVATTATLITLPVGFAVAWVLAFSRIRWKPLLDGLINLPLVLPPVVIGYMLLLLLGRQGPLGELFNALGFQIIFTWRGAVVACSVIGLPLMVRSIRLGMEQIDLQLIHASRTLGAGFFDTLLSLVLPLSIPSLVTGGTLCFARSLGEFGATIILAGNIPGLTQTIPLAIYDYTNTPGGETGALSLCLVSIVISYLVLITNEIIMRRSVHGLRKVS